MKIGIVTVEKSANVGSFLQAYALQKVLEAWGHEVYFVSAGQESFFKREYCWFIPKRGNLKYPVKFIKRNLDGLKKYKLFAQDHKKLKTWDKKEKLDLFILGSDEIWNVQRKIFRIRFIMEKIFLRSFPMRSVSETQKERIFFLFMR